MRDRHRPVVLVTGASSGLGNACATHLAKKGYSVYGTSRDPETRQRRADEFFELIRMDVSNDDSVSSAVFYILAREERIDALVHCVGTGIAGAVEETLIVDASRQMDVNFLGCARVVREVLPGMRKHGGSILILGSMAGKTGIPFQSYYAASKFALEGFVDSLRMELTGFPVRVSIIEPGDFLTGFSAARTIVGLAPESPYHQNGINAIQAMVESEREGSDPVMVARLVLRLIQKKRLLARYSVGPWYQRLALVLHGIVPYIIYERILMAYFRIDARNGAH